MSGRLPGPRTMAEREIRNLAFLQRISAIVYPVHTTIFLTSTQWAGVAREASALKGLKTSKGRKPTPRNFSQLQIGRLTAVNSTTEDQDVCDMLNAEQERLSDFRAKHDRLAQRAGTVPEGDWTDAKSTHEVPDELMKEIEAKLRRERNTIDIEVVR